jgi:uncharacterized repeat protein (TIGR03803 family)
MSNLSLWRKICLVSVFFAVGVIGAPAQTASPVRAQGGTDVRPDMEMIFPPEPIFTTLVNFDGNDGGIPTAGLVQGMDGHLYGTAEFAGKYGAPNFGGTVFGITTGGVLTTLYSFCAQSGWADGGNVTAGLALGTDGNFYGTTSAGGADSGFGVVHGTVFQITPSGTLTTLYSFCALSYCADGAYPGGLLLATDGNFYGTTALGGANNAPGCNQTYSTKGCGTIFKVGTKGTPETTRLTTLYSFCAQTNCTDGASPAALVQGSDGNFYGTTSLGGAYSHGTVFKITPWRSLTTLYSFCSHSGCPDGFSPAAALVQATDGNFYGTTSSGGANGGGTVFRITPTGRLTTLYNFCSQSNCTDGKTPTGYAGVVQGTDGNFYGATFLGGAYGYGTAFKITPDGMLTTLHSFCAQSGCADGANPGPLLQDTNGAFYGTAEAGGNASYPCDGWIDGCTAAGCGTVFSLDVGLGPFVRTLPTFGALGTPVIILGNSLTGATGVSFNGAAARFTVVSDTEIETTVPAGATTGKVQVTTFTGALTSNVPFQVTTPCVTGPGCMLPMGQ